MQKIILALVMLLFCSVTQAQVSLQLTMSPAVQAKVPSQGRLLLYVSKDSAREPMQTIDPADAKGSGFRFAQDVTWNGKQPFFVGNRLMGFPKRSLQGLDTGTYYMQAVYDVDTTTYRLFVAPNIYSAAKKIHVTKKQNQTITIVLNKQFDVPQYKDSRFTKFISVRSQLLSNFWKRDVVLHAAVALPPDYDSTGSTRYPVVYKIGGYGTDCRNMAYYGPDSTYISKHTKNKAPEMLEVLLDSDAPYGDSYQMNSENNGPYMDALTQELIPAIEQKFHGYGTPESRFLTGGSTGGWVSLALQIFNPDFFNGCWSFYGDPVDFNFFQLVNLYKDDNAYVNRFGNLNPSMRTVYGEPMLTIKDEVSHENVLGRHNSYVFSGDQWGGWNAVYSPKSKSGVPAAIWNPVTGAIDSNVAKQWKKWDLHLYLQAHWKELGPKLQGKLHIWMGDMDTYYLNDAMRLFEQFIKSTEAPHSDAQITFGPMQVHGWEPLNRFEVMQQMKQRFDSTSKKGF